VIRKFKKITPTIGSNCYIDPSAVIIGDVVIGDHCSVWPMSVIRGDVNFIRIGNNTNIQDGSVLHVSHAGKLNPEGAALRIGNNVTVGHKVILHACEIGDFCLIGMGSIVMDEAILEKQVMLGAGSLVPPGKTLTSRHLWLGSPVKKVRPLSKQEIEYLEYSAKHYIHLKKRYLDC